MRKDSINQDAIEKAYLIYSEHGHQTVDYDFSHPPTDYKRGTVEEPESTSKLRDSYNELLPGGVRKSEFDSLVAKKDQIEKEIEGLQAAMVDSRARGNFQGLQNQMRQLKDKVKEKESIDAKMAATNLELTQDNMHKSDAHDHSEFAEMGDLASRIADLETALKGFMGE
jgi:uncharacterized protein YdcH (DUF465 family)